MRLSTRGPLQKSRSWADAICAHELEFAIMPALGAQSLQERCMKCRRRHGTSPCKNPPPLLPRWTLFLLFGLSLLLPFFYVLEPD